MAWFAFVLSVLLQAAAPSAPTPASPRQAAAAPVRPRLWREIAPATVNFAPGSARVERDGIALPKLTSVGHHRPQVANRRLSERRIRPFATALAHDGIPHALMMPPVGETAREVMPPDGAPDPFDHYARIIFPVPPPLR